MLKGPPPSDISTTVDTSTTDDTSTTTTTDTTTANFGVLIRSSLWHNNVSIWCDDFPSSGSPVSSEDFSIIVENSLSVGSAESSYINFSIDNLDL